MAEREAALYQDQVRRDFRPREDLGGEVPDKAGLERPKGCKPHAREVTQEQGTGDRVLVKDLIASRVEMGKQRKRN